MVNSYEFLTKLCDAGKKIRSNADRLVKLTEKNLKHYEESRSYNEDDPSPDLPEWDPALRPSKLSDNADTLFPEAHTNRDCQSSQRTATLPQTSSNSFLPIGMTNTLTWNTAFKKMQPSASFAPYFNLTAQGIKHGLLMEFLLGIG